MDAEEEDNSLLERNGGSLMKYFCSLFRMGLFSSTLAVDMASFTITGVPQPSQGESTFDLTFSESSALLLQILMKLIGARLRSEDPASFRDLLISFRKAMAQRVKDGLEETSRLRFLADAIESIKDNRAKQEGKEDDERARKWIKRFAVSKQKLL